MNFHTALLQFWASADMFVLVRSLDDQSVTPLMGGAKAMAFSLRRGPWQKHNKKTQTHKQTLGLTDRFPQLCGFQKYDICNGINLPRRYDSLTP